MVAQALQQEVKGQLSFVNPQSTLPHPAAESHPHVAAPDRSLALRQLKHRVLVLSAQLEA
jgi:hypothetical protein